MCPPSNIPGEDRLLQLRNRLAHVAGARRLVSLPPTLFAVRPRTAAAGKMSVTALMSVSVPLRNTLESLSVRDGEMPIARFA